jgi:tetratricopeptide (TPR) repeat protein
LAWALQSSDEDRAARLFQESFELAREMSSLQAYYALLGLGEVALQRGEHERACAFFEQGIALAQEMGAPNYLQGCVEGLSMADRQRSIVMSEQRLAHAREAGDAHALAQSLHQLGHLLLDAGDFAQARPILEECLGLWQELGIEWSMAGCVTFATFDLAHIARFQGDYSLATIRYNESMGLYRRNSGAFGVAGTHSCLGYVAFAQRDFARAANHFRDSLLAFRELGPNPYIPGVLAGMAETARAQGRAVFAARLAGAAAALLPEQTRVTMRPIDRWDYERIMADFRAQLNDPEIVAAWAEGQAMSLQQAVAYALGDDSTQQIGNE